MNQDADNSPESNASERVMVGVSPWLPWPWSASAWWNDPVRAERLAAWRIAVSLCVIFDFAYNYLPEALAYFGKGVLGDPALFDYRFRSSRMTWSLLRGVSDPSTFYLSLAILLAATCWILGNALGVLLQPPEKSPKHDRSGASLWIWSAAFVWYVAGLWANMLEKAEFDSLAWVVPLLGLSLSCLFHALDIGAMLRDPNHRIPWPALVWTFLVAVTLTVIGFVFTWFPPDKSVWWAPILRPWQESDTIVMTLVFVFLASAFLMLIGLQTRFATVLTWLLSMSFYHGNPYLENAGDTIRVILLLYLMLCPCGAVWSVDSLFRRQAPASTPLYVHPWAIRLMFVQMIYIYFMNGMYKVTGPDWLKGDSLHYVLGDLVLTRFSPMMLPLPIWLSRLMTWSVLIWEVSFPLLIWMKWTRLAALIMGVMFHLGIFATMELGGFVPYALCMYIPLLPWGEWTSRAARSEGTRFR
jgi:hypothetical protein